MCVDVSDVSSEALPPSSPAFLVLWGRLNGENRKISFELFRAWKFSKKEREKVQVIRDVTVRGSLERERHYYWFCVFGRNV